MGQRQWMAQWNQIGGTLGRHDTRDAGDAQHISFLVAALQNHLQGCRLHRDTAFAYGDAMADIFIADIDHVGFTRLIEMGQFTHLRRFPGRLSVRSGERLFSFDALGYLTYLELHGLQVSQQIGCRVAADSPDGARIHQCCGTPLDIGYVFDLNFMAVAAADQVPVTGGGHGARVVRVVHQENALFGQRNTGVHAMVLNDIFRVSRELAQRVKVTRIVPVDQVHLKLVLDKAFKCARRDHVTTMEHCLGTILFGFRHRRIQQSDMVVAIG